MAIAHLQITDFRNLATIDLTPCERGINILYGDNGSGKTSLLEAIYYLGLGRSFRTSLAHSIIRHSSQKFSLFARFINSNERSIPIGVEREINGSLRLRLEEKELTSISELATLLPLRVINSLSFQLLEAGPAARRKYLDWGLFYQNDNFLACWRAYERILKQRNALLRERRSKNELNTWTEELAKYGEELNRMRANYVLAVIPFIEEMIQELLAIPQLSITYQSGWDQSLSYTEALNQNYGEEMRFGRTLLGPHRADLDLRINGVEVKHFLSRGQQKLLICAMILAQGKLLAKQVNKKLIYLIDDLPSELDYQSKSRLIFLLSRQPTQIFITAIERQMIDGLIKNDFELPVKVFHVKHGSVRVES